MLLGAFVMYFTVRERPEDIGLQGPQDDRTPAEAARPEASAETSLSRYKAVLTNWRLYATGLSIGFQNAARYALLVWIPVHFLGPNWKTAASVIDPVWITVALPVGMALGASTNSWISDVQFRSKRYIAIITYMVLGAATAFAMQTIPHGSMLGIFGLFPVRLLRLRACIVFLGALPGYFRAPAFRYPHWRTALHLLRLCCAPVAQFQRCSSGADNAISVNLPSAIR